MKKLISIIFIVVFALAMMTVISCNKDKTTPKTTVDATTDVKKVDATKDATADIKK